MVFSELRRQRRNDELAAGLAISIAGWQWKWHWYGKTAQLRPLRPIICRIYYSPQPIPGFMLERLPRYWGWERNVWWLESMPPLPTYIRDRLQAKLNESILDGTVIERLLLDAIREVANDPRRGVSQDCVTTSLVPQRDPFVIVRYNLEFRDLGRSCGGGFPGQERVGEFGIGGLTRRSVLIFGEHGAAECGQHV